MKKIKRVSAKDQVLSSMRKAIFDGSLQTKQEITQEEIAGLLGVSRMPVREAFQILAREGLIEIDENRRVTVIGLSLEDINDHYKIRSLLEGMAATKACDHPEFFQSLEQLHDQIAQSIQTGDNRLYVELNEEFHQTIWKASNSARLQTILSDLWNGLQPQFPEFVSGQIQKSIKEHEAILQAIINTDKDAARKCMENHIIRTRDSFVTHYEKNQRNLVQR